MLVCVNDSFRRLQREEPWIEAPKIYQCTCDGVPLLESVTKCDMQFLRPITIEKAALVVSAPCE